MTHTPDSHTELSSNAARIAVLLPCYNEAITIGKVVADFRRTLPAADIYVFDNNSTDDTAGKAAAAGATVLRSRRQGKGHVVQHMFHVVEADIYVLADGDDTYPAEAAAEMIRILQEADADMVIGTRMENSEPGAFRIMHEFGNRLISKLVSVLFRSPVTDVLSGYRVFREHFARTLYLRSGGFEIETEITLQAIAKSCVIKEIPVTYAVRPPGSISKLNTLTDGLHVLKCVILIFKDYKPLVFFSCMSILSFIFGLAAGWYPVTDYLETRFVSHVPLALLAAALEILAVLFLGIGLILSAIHRYHMENQELIGNLCEFVFRLKKRD
jgi:glycosyltransferase involved in cell wall biosynthesis